ncbi:MAG: hypothetical protein D6795_00270 [Deltaproteobacteria bacterium]|nr:MAG: hypothetical protein D6795_00270 [Deltaproteobacteria bacterium]
MFRGFWHQPNRAYRNMQIVLGLLAIHYFIPALIYFFAPQIAVDQFKRMGEIVGASYPFSEESHLWRVLAAGNVFTLGFLCLLMQLDIRRFYPVLPVFVVLKGFSSLGYLYVFLFTLRYPVFFGVFLWDGCNVLLVWHFARKAYHTLVAGENETNLVPPLFFREMS